MSTYIYIFLLMLPYDYITFSNNRQAYRQYFLRVCEEFIFLIVNLFIIKTVNKKFQLYINNSYVPKNGLSHTFSLFLSVFPRAAPSSMVLGRGYAKWRAVFFYTKSYFSLVGGTSPIPFSKKKDRILLQSHISNSFIMINFPHCLSLFLRTGQFLPYAPNQLTQELPIINVINQKHFLRPVIR